jgi:signal transduction histidine kinase
VRRRSARADSEEIHVSRGILSRVLGSGSSILTADAGADVRLAAHISIVAQNIRSAICVPIRGRRQTVGAIYIDTVIGVGVFGKDDLEMLSTIGVLAGTALESIQLFRENLQQERMAAIGKVIACLGHDIRNMLTALRGGMYLVDETMKDHESEDARTAWEIVKHGHESIAGLVQDMVNYSKPREPSWTLCDVNQIASGAIGFAREYAKDKNVQITEMLDPTIEPIQLEPAAIERCVLNLLTNAVDAVDNDTGVVGVQTQVDDAKRTVRIVVQDNGTGIAPENQDKIFDLLFSTKGQRGTGFGLAITKKIVEEHGGTVSFRSEVGRGTAFTIELPMRATRPAASPTA